MEEAPDKLPQRRSSSSSRPIPPKRPWRRRLLIGLLVILALLRVTWLFRPRNVQREIKISPETTYVTEPRTPDGFVDFASALNARYGDGVTPDNNAAVLLIQAQGPGEIAPPLRARYFKLIGIPPIPNEGDYLLDERQFLRAQGLGEQQLTVATDQFIEELRTAFERPWTDEEFPELAAYLAAHEVPLELVVQASRRTHFFSPIAEQDQVLLSVSMPVEQRARLAARLLLLRGTRRMAEGDVPAAWDDVLACYRLARLIGQSPSTIGLLVSYALEADANLGAQALICSDRLSATQARQCLRDLDALRPLSQAVDVINFGERLTTLDSFCRLATGRLSPEAVGQAKPDGTFKGRLLDCNVVLKEVNRHMDEMVSLMQLPDPVEREAELKRFLDEFLVEMDSWSPFIAGLFGNSESMSRIFAKSLLSLMAPAMQRTRSAEASAEARIELTRLGFALAVNQRENGSYPKTLAELAPAILPEVPLDSCSGEDFIYRRTEDGFVLYSVGFNLTDDGGVDDPEIDIVLRVPMREVADDTPYADN